MTGFTTGIDHLTRSNVWSNELKMILEDELQATKYIRMLSDFPDGDTINIPSIGQATVDNYVEDQSVKYRAMDTGNFTFTINEYLSSATYITDKYKQDTFYMNELVSSFVPKQARAIMTHFETNVMALSASQTLSNANTINGAAHRFVGSGVNETIAIEDFAKARYALTKANVPMTNLTAIVDPSVEFALSTLPNITNVSFNPRWEGIVSTGISTGMKFIVNIYGFDVYTSNYLADANETIGGLTTAAGKANMFFSAASDVLPFVGAWRQEPRVESERNKDYQRDEFLTTARYGTKLFRPENLVVVLTDTDQV
jgi:hypothetical protein